ncbi:CHASE2 domain-containing protein [[Limnothrix rosea] IAM M-220]|uniref:CHASE2 domain-containing protein n=1 Tax=[Limnothrix rosea] IAM M-220 TaxID=454133 RepID=UPI0009619967|nr:CHASE2 domain-containing protein [[Limnothrix rosea] IAM M-220]OKH12690.1 hypothetical protein NIES208_15825 [[Limnothrix rosea] IAM M-220]
MAKLNRKLWIKSRRWAKKNARVFFTAGSVSAVIIGLRFFSLLQIFELAAFDALLNFRPAEPTDDRVRVVAINQRDINQYKWPLEDTILAELIQKIDAQQPAAIGLDIVRDRPLGRGQAELETVIRNLPYFVGIEVLNVDPDFRTPALPIMWKEDENGELKDGVGFNNFPLDADGVVRRNSLYWTVDGNTKRSFALQLAWQYLERIEGIYPEGYPAENPRYLKLGSTIFYDLRDFHSLYGWLNPQDNYQMVSNLRQPEKLSMVSLSEVMNDEIPPDFFRDRIVMIGDISESTKDLFLSPFRNRFSSNLDRIGGVEIHANFTSEILSATLDGRPLISFFSLWQDSLFIIVAATLGSAVVWRWRSPIRGGIALLISISSLLGGSYILFFTSGLVFPIFPCLLSLMGSATVVTMYLAHQEKELSRSKEFFQLIINNIPDPVFVKDSNYVLTVVNDAFCRLIGRSAAAVVGKSDHDLFIPSEAQHFRQQDEKVLQTKTSKENEESLTSSNGENYLLATKRSLHKDGAGNIFLVGVIRDITERKKLEAELRRTAEELTRSNHELKASEKRLRHQANHDPLTGLPNRKLFYETLQQLLDWGESNKQLVSLLFLDLDGFKPVNDTLGHDIGDMLLQAVAQRIKNCLRMSDVVSRLGGDEFTVLLPGIKQPLDSAIVAQKILATVSAPYKLDDHDINITVSIGISVYPEDDTSVAELIKLADTAMYKAKRSGRNQYCMTPNLIHIAEQNLEKQL